MLVSALFLATFACLAGNSLQGKPAQNCVRGHPLLSNVEKELNKQNFQEQVSSSRMVLLQITSSECENCCLFEKELHSFKQ